MFGAALREMTAGSSESGRLRGRPGRSATGGMPSICARAWVTPLMLAALASRQADVKEANLRPPSDRSEILEADREGPQVWSGRPTVSDRSTPTLG